MKKLIYLFLLFPLLSYSQITVTSANLPNIGDTVITASDFGSYMPGASGANQNWNFSNAAGTPAMLLGFIDPLITPYQANFPTSNICVKIDSATYFYLNRSVDGLAAVGGPGVARAIEIIRTDIVRTMKLLGCESVDKLDPSFVTIPDSWKQY